MEIISLEDVIAANHIGIYKSERDAIWQRLINAATNIFILEKIADFPFHLFAPSAPDQHFWNATFNALLKDAILALWHVNWDKSKNVSDSGELRLTRFENKITHKWMREDIDADVHDELKRRLARLRINKQQIEKLGIKVDKIRNEIIAHLDYTASQQRVMSQDHKMTVNELKYLLLHCEKWFQTLCLDVYLDLNLWEYHEGNKWTDIDTILCLIASQSIYLKSHSNEWLIDSQREETEKLSMEDKLLLDIWRKKIQTTLLN